MKPAVPNRVTSLGIGPASTSFFIWLEYVIIIPNPIYRITTYKENGKPNANLQSWGFPVGDNANYSFLLALLDQTHTFSNILRTREFCINYPSFQHYPACFATIDRNQMEYGEITDAGFSPEPAQVVHAPRIAKCFMNMGCCMLRWMKR